MNLFQQYESEFLRVRSSLSSRRESVSDGGLDAQIREAEELVSKMLFEAGSLSLEERKTALAKVRRYQEEVASLREALKRNSNRGTRAQLGLTSDPARDASAAQRERLLNSTAKLEKTGQRLTESRQMLAGMEEQGAAILQNLHSQRETIQRSQQRLHEADANISQSQTILKRMSRWLPF
ncbi:probable vesicle transport through interaction with t-SNAREs homolog [Coccomyxa sp. Obi]|nr:probable vesicle transport through interaction with t-SNAREs homolog [Coccomyxa sp. Obi]